MKILLATYWELPHLGGVWPLMSQLKESLESRGHEVDIMGNSNDYFHIINKNERLHKETLMPLILSKLSRSCLALSPWIMQTEADRYCMELSAAYFGIANYDLIHTHDAISSRALSRVKASHTPLVASLHGSLPNEIRLLPKTNGLTPVQKEQLVDFYQTLELEGVQSSTVTIASSQWMKNILTSQGVTPEQITVFPYGLDVNHFSKRMREKSDIVKPKGKKVIMYTGRLVHLKGIQYLLVALSKLHKARSDWECWIVGEGEMGNNLISFSMELGLSEYVKFLGSRNDIPALMGMCDIYVQPSLQDNQPYSVIEAQVAGKPVVTTYAGGLPEMVQHGVTGLISPHSEAELLYQHLHLLLANDGFRKDLGRNAAEWGRTYWLLERNFENTLDVYSQALAKRG
ncbi:hypothetical protein SY83_07145 [Paenibacillus swuensis]|uniref:Glycosyl transferase n=1 Tax=Paenibacillus swuensis TaxID=1178515 RepID=A0A172TGA8_9BACL|nr:hypothetical protein SY83_07145 [Paenibacillus swuensis]